MLVYPNLFVKYHTKVIAKHTLFRQQLHKMYMTTSSALWSRRRLVPVLWELMRPLRAEGSASVPAVVCTFCATSLAKNL